MLNFKHSRTYFKNNWKYLKGYIFLKKQQIQVLQSRVKIGHPAYPKITLLFYKLCASRFSSNKTFVQDICIYFSGSFCN